MLIRGLSRVAQARAAPLRPKILTCSAFRTAQRLFVSRTLPRRGHNLEVLVQEEFLSTLSQTQVLLSTSEKRRVDQWYTFRVYTALSRTTTTFQSTSRACRLHWRVGAFWARSYSCCARPRGRCCIRTTTSRDVGCFLGRSVPRLSMFLRKFVSENPLKNVRRTSSRGYELRSSHALLEEMIHLFEMIHVPLRCLAEGGWGFAAVR